MWVIESFTAHVPLSINTHGFWLCIEGTFLLLSKCILCIHKEKFKRIENQKYHQTAYTEQSFPRHHRNSTPCTYENKQSFTRAKISFPLRGNTAIKCHSCLFHSRLGSAGSVNITFPPALHAELCCRGKQGSFWSQCKHSLFDTHATFKQGLFLLFAVFEMNSIQTGRWSPFNPMYPNNFK